MLVELVDELTENLARAFGFEEEKDDRSPLTVELNALWSSLKGLEELLENVVIDSARQAR
ncbi:MAG: hypothetical protein M3394_01490 [Actinomycetota bacterium]|nr:hypothetical protein [Actinomycetota bacterium]